jgi:4-hydroxy-tetrahydrodipicolinate synthase
LVTPFTGDGQIDYDALRAHVDFQVGNGVNVLVPVGTTGEGVTMSVQEQQDVIRATVEAAAGKVPVMAGAGSNRTELAIELALNAKAAGADAVLSVGPFYNKPTQEGFYQHFRSVALEAEIPVFVYNVPGRTGSNIHPETILRLAKVDYVWGVKEASGDLDQAMTLIREGPQDFVVLSGEDSLALATTALGGDGVISVAANEAPDQMAALIEAGIAGDFDTGRELHYRLLPLMRVNFIETNPIPVKTALEMMGRMSANFRLPLTPISDDNRGPLSAALREAGVLS